MNNEELNKAIEDLENYINQSGLKDTDSIDKQRLLDRINELLVFSPDNVVLLNWKALCYELIEDYENAISTYEYILKLQPDNKEIRELLFKCRNDSLLNNTHKTNLNKNNFLYNFDFIQKIPVNILVISKILILLFLFIFYFPYFIFSHFDNKILNIKDYTKFDKININAPTEYNFLSKNEILNLRKKFVEKSLFNKNNYEPNSSVFGSIQSHKPWWGLVSCLDLNYKGDYHERIEGPSKVSIQMNNPDILVGISLPYLPWNIPYFSEFCSSDYSKFIPSYAAYDKDNNFITVKYPFSEKILRKKMRVNNKSTRLLLQLSGLNALDFDYKYAYIFDTKNIKMFSEKNSAKNDIVFFKDYIHVGSSCKYKGGCNNISPMQNDLLFSVISLPAELNIKLWKNKPLNKYSKADIYFKIIFENKD